MKNNRLKRVGMLFILLSITVFLLSLWQALNFIKPIKTIQSGLQDYDHVNVQIIDVLACVDSHETDINNRENSYYLYLVELESEEHAVVMYESSIPSLSQFRSTLPIKVDGTVYLLSSKDENRAKNSLGNDSDKTFYPYKIIGTVFPMSGFIIGTIVLCLGIICYILDKKYVDN